MKRLQEYVAESIVNEAAPKFTNDEQGIKEFCDYVFDTQFIKYVINSDLTITLENIGRSKIAYMNPQDLQEIPEFITFSNIPGVSLGITDNKKLKKWAPKVVGGCAGIVIENDKKLEILDLSECDINAGGLLHIVKTNISDIIGGKGQEVQLRILKNKNLSELNLSSFVGYAHGSHISKNKSLMAKKNQVPKKVDGQNHFNIEDNAGGYETAGAVTKWDKE